MKDNIPSNKDLGGVSDGNADGSAYEFTLYRKAVLPLLRITVSATQVHLTQETYIKLGSPDRLTLLYDKERNVIQLTGQDDAYAMKVKVSRGKYYSLSTQFGKKGVMPKGVYALIDPKQGIFELTTPTNESTKSGKGAV
jgi:hypothetical protein